jgi:hypothetical protein
VSTLEQIYLDFCFSLLNYSLYTDKYKSVLIVALAILSLIKHGFRGSYDYPFMLSSLIKTFRFMIVQLIIQPSKATKDFFYDLSTET